MRHFKIIIHTPVEYADHIRTALGNIGAGTVGNYSHCSFTYRGTGRFKANDGANPYIGKKGSIQTIEEESIEISFIPETILKNVVNKLAEVHPYDEPAFEIIELFDIKTL